jgi:hypothetical protein
MHYNICLVESLASTYQIPVVATLHSEPKMSPGITNSPQLLVENHSTVLSSSTSSEVSANVLGFLLWSCC